MLTYSRNGFLIVESPVAETQVTIYTTAGQIQARCQVSGTKSIALPKGIYMVKAGTEVRKVIIRD
ncbi:hypothetical protein Barb7_03001 [Bacteroidales bacterium Barb7]|nr:hypothetical protein Barb7_03001 [Bacteroidales bacterium Barb7]